MSNQAMTQELITRAQFDGMIKLLDEWLQIYTQAIFILFVVVLCLFAWLVISEMTAPKTNKKLRIYRQAPDKPRLLRTEP
jgi:hypothetical protein